MVNKQPFHSPTRPGYIIREGHFLTQRHEMPSAIQLGKKLQLVCIQWLFTKDCWSARMQLEKIRRELSKCICAEVMFL